MDNNMKLYSAVRECPEAALRKINAGRLKGMSDINPMWRIQKLTEVFGPCGVGWYYDIKKQWIEDGASGERVAFTNIDLYIKDGEEWSKPIPGTGGSMFIANEKSGAHTSDEAFKMALTDAISVSCKALGFAANVYWAAGRSKYSGQPETGSGQSETTDARRDNKRAQKPSRKYVCAHCGNEFRDMAKDGVTYSAEALYKMSIQNHGMPYCSGTCARAAAKEAHANEDRTA